MGDIIDIRGGQSERNGWESNAEEKSAKCRKSRGEREGSHGISWICHRPRMVVMEAPECYEGYSRCDS